MDYINKLILDNINSGEYIPNHLKGILHYNIITNAMDEVILKLTRNLQRLKENKNIDTLNPEMIDLYEYLYNIFSSSPSEDLDFRRQRIKNRQSIKPPFTRKFLVERLDDIIGDGTYKLTIDGNNYTIILESGIENQDWYGEVSATINTIKPANLLFINKPLIAQTSKIGESIFTGGITYNYKLGTSWNLGSKPFTSAYDGSVIKTSGVKSLNQQFINDSLNCKLNIINKVVLNGNYTISLANLTKEIVDGKGQLSYSVSQNNISNITKIQLYNSSNQLLSETNVPIPIVDSVTIVHSFSEVDIANV